MTAARMLTDADVALVRDLLRDVVREELANRDVKPANGAPRPRRRRGDRPKRVASPEMVEAMARKLRR